MEAIAVGDSGGGEGEEEEGEEGEKEEGEEGEKVASTAATKQEAQVSCHGNILASFFYLTLYLLSTCLSTFMLYTHRMVPSNVVPNSSFRGSIWLTNPPKILHDTAKAPGIVRIRLSLDLSVYTGVPSRPASC